MKPLALLVVATLATFGAIENTDAWIGVVLALVGGLSWVGLLGMMAEACRY